MKFTIWFTDGGRIDDEATEAADITELLRLQKARENGHTHLTVGAAGGRLYTVGDIRSIEVDGVAS